MKTLTRTVERDAPVITDGAVTVTMSTDQRDRYGDRISQDGTIDGQAFGRGLILDEWQFAVIIPCARTNLITNPSFELGTTGWAALGGAAISRVTTWSASIRASRSCASCSAAMVAMVVPVVEYEVKLLTCPRVTTLPEPDSVSTKSALPFSA